ncbi:MAG: hypothetical protein HKP40_07615 [Litoreibacter sp.]|nr:hypothetical protein [Litoreibacter sp.]
MLINSLSGKLARTAFLALLAMSGPTIAQVAAKTCSGALVREIPKRDAGAPSGSAVMKELSERRGTARDRAVVRQVLSGNMPSFLRRLSVVSIPGTLPSGQEVTVSLCVTPEYLAVGSDRDFVRVPLGLPAAAHVADSFGFLLPTPRMVDAIYRQAKKRIAPSPMKPTAQMESTDYLMRHNETVDLQLADLGDPGPLTAGHKKDLVLSKRLLSKPGRVAIYGWHRPNGKPIQPLSTVHGAAYADYSHGVRLVSSTAYVNGKPTPLEDILQDSELSNIVTGEGPIRDADRMMAGLSRLIAN